MADNPPRTAAWSFRCSSLPPRRDEQDFCFELEHLLQPVAEQRAGHRFPGYHCWGLLGCMGCSTPASSCRQLQQPEQMDSQDQSHRMTVAARLAEHAAPLSALDPRDVPTGICLCASSRRTIACIGRRIETSILLGRKVAEVREAGQMTWRGKR